MDDVSVLWDLEDDPDGNVQHIAENDLSVEEVEEVLLDPDNEVQVSRTTGRPITFGWTSTGRYTSPSSGRRSSTTPEPSGCGLPTK